MALTQTQFIIDLFLLLAGSLAAGEIFSRIGQPALVGQLIVGVILGPTLFGASLGLSSLPAEFASLQFLATIFILFMAGLEIVPEEIYRMGGLTALLGVAVFVVPFGTGFVVVSALFLGVSTLKALFISLTLSITALPVMGIMVTQFGLLRRPLGRLLMNLALINELAAVTTFAVLLSLYSGNSSGVVSVGFAFVSLGIFLGVMLGGYFVVRWLARTTAWSTLQKRFSTDLRSKGAAFAVLMVLIVGASLFSQYLGLTFVIGAFYAGLLVTRETAGEEAHRSISTVFDTISWGFFIPVFFALVGLQMNLRLIGAPDDLLVFVGLLAFAIVTKVLIGSFAGHVKGFGWSDAQAVGFLVSSRGAVELAMAVILLQDGLFNIQLFTIVAGVGLITTAIAPIGALWAWQSTPESAEELYLRVPSLRPRRGRALIRAPALQWGDVRDYYDGGPTGPPPEEPALPTADTVAPPPPVPPPEIIDRPPLPDDPRKRVPPD
jgi:Kef-type K+ transport system membrane component KefB